MLYYYQFFCLVFEMKQFYLPILLSVSESKLSSLYSRFISFTVLVAQDGY